MQDKKIDIWDPNSLVDISSAFIIREPGISGLEKTAPLGELESFLDQSRKTLVVIFRSR